ncbi:MAG: DUF721 domain-containing protein [Flavobacteriaceae bacterium]
MKRIRKTERINVMLNDFMNQEKISDGIFNVKINEAWKKSVGKNVYKYTKSVNLKDNILYIEVDNPILKQEILYSKQKIIDMLNEEINEKNYR